MITGVGLGILPSLDEAGAMIRPSGTYQPNSVNHAVYEKYYAVFKQLHKCNAKLFKASAL